MHCVDADAVCLTALSSDRIGSMCVITWGYYTKDAIYVANGVVCTTQQHRYIPQTHTMCVGLNLIWLSSGDYLIHDWKCNCISDTLQIVCMGVF